MSQLEHPRSEQSALYRPQEDSPTPWMVSSAPSQIPAYYLPTFQSAPWSSTLVCDGATKDQVRLQQDCVVQRTIVSTRQKKGANTRFWSLFKELFRKGIGLAFQRAGAHDHCRGRDEKGNEETRCAYCSIQPTPPTERRALYSSGGEPRPGSQLECVLFVATDAFSL